MKPGLAKKYLEKTRDDYQFLNKEFSDTRFLPWPEMTALAQKYVKPGDSVLDLGCGNGRLFEVFAGTKVDYLGMDPVRVLLEKAREKFPQAKFVRGDALDLHSVNDQKFDAVFLIAVLHQIPSRELQLKVLKNVKDILKPGGHLIMENWNFLQRRYLRYWFTKYLIDPKLPFADLLIPWKAEKPVWRYYHAFTLNELASLVKESGLKLIEQYYVKKGQKVNRWHGYNIVTVARK